MRKIIKQSRRNWQIIGLLKNSLEKNKKAGTENLVQQGLSFTVGGNINDVTTFEVKLAVLTKLNIGLPYELVIVLLRIYPNELKI